MGFVDETPILSAPQSNLTQEGESFDPETAVDSLLKRLENSPGLEDNIAVLQYYARSTDFVETKEMSAAIGYDPQADVIRYNPDMPLPAGVDKDGILLHELGHRADSLMYKASESPVWKDAVRQAAETLAGQEPEIETWFAPGGKYENDAFLSDTISAVFKGAIDVPYSHPVAYWENESTRENEIFANLAAMSALGTTGACEADGSLRTLYVVFTKIIKQGR